MESLRERFAHALARTDESPAALAKKIGVTRQTIYNIENGTTKAGAIRAVTLYPLADALGVRAEWLLFGRGPRDLSDSASEIGVKSGSQSGTASQSLTLDPAILLEAETLVLTDEAQTQRRYSPLERARQLTNAYVMLAAEGGRLSSATNAQFVDTAGDRIERGDTENGVDRKGDHRAAKRGKHG